jgi:uncharacterized protein YjbJ (UPF0337 family)
MSITTNIKHKAETARGTARKAAGHVTGRRPKQAKGRGEQFMGRLMQALAKIRDAFRH